jgi:hypothetical protein
MPTQKTVSNRLLASLAAVIRYIISRAVAIQRQDGTYFPVYDAAEWQLQLQSQRTFRLFNIFERGLYTEFHKNYPIQDIADIKSVLMQEFGASAQHQISPLLQSSRRVSSYVFDKDIIESIRIPCFTMPASMFLAKAFTEKNTTVTISETPLWFLAKFSDTVVSQRQSGLITDIQRFRFNQGLPEELPHHEVNGGQSWKLVLKAAMKVKPNELRGFWRHPDASLLNSHWRSYATATVLVGALYMLASSLFINMQADSRSQQIAAMGDELNVLLDKQFQLTTDVTSIRTLAELQSGQVLAAPTWVLVSYLLEHSATLLDLRQSLHTIEIRGRAARATDVLVKLREHEGVQSAEFTSPTVKVENQEEFTVRILLNTRSAYAVK